MVVMVGLLTVMDHIMADEGEVHHTVAAMDITTLHLAEAEDEAGKYSSERFSFAPTPHILDSQVMTTNELIAMR